MLLLNELVFQSIALRSLLLCAPLCVQNVLDADGLELQLTLFLLIDLAEQHDVFAAYDEDAARYVAVLGADVDAFDRLVQHQIGELIDAAQVADQRATVAQQDHQFL